MRRNNYQKQNKHLPIEYMLINGDLHQVVTGTGQLIMKEDYDNLLRRYKKLLKLAHVRGIIGKKAKCTTIITSTHNEDWVYA